MAEDGVLPYDGVWDFIHYDALIVLIYTFPGYNINTLRDYALKEGIKHYVRGKG